jgi:ABC-type multidrug transport system fused ATPase/permease subunit
MSGHGAEVEIPHNENDPFVKRVGLSVAIFAVILAVAGAGGKNAGKDMMSSQLDAANEYSQYQAKSQREVMYTQERESLETVVMVPEGKLKELAKTYEQGLKDRKLLPADVGERQRQRLAYISTKLDEYVGEKKALDEKGKEYISERKLAHRKDGYFDFAELFLQIAIVLASISMLSKARWPYSISLVLAVIGLVLAIGGFVIPTQFPGVHIPFIDAAH